MINYTKLNFIWIHQERRRRGKRRETCQGKQNSFLVIILFIFRDENFHKNHYHYVDTIVMIMFVNVNFAFSSFSLTICSSFVFNLQAKTI